MKYQIHKAAGILIKNRKLLVEKSVNKDFFISPGGSVEPGESAKQTLVRELLEEFNVQVNEDDLSEFGTFTAKAAGQEDKIVKMDVFIVNKWFGEPEPDHEVEKILWINSSIPENIKVGSIFEHEVIPRLIKQNLID